ncbi:hypothetical protein EYZ11_002470 [Aspergillus tanneri]|uniref:UBX domain-containing protein n=1 Tax=Aspergillus tanneri TaxID=1220188 RepID=A0A4V6RQX5_9EURO|nr:hypothetical protein EYZ11_002470 [Aspergillus tanneri]
MIARRAQNGRKIISRMMRNGTLREYIIPEISKDTFHQRLRAALEDMNRPDNETTATSVQSSNIPIPTTPARAATSQPTPAPAAVAPASTTVVPRQEPAPTQQPSINGKKSSPPRETKKTESRDESRPIPKPYPQSLKKDAKPAAPREPVKQKELQGSRIRIPQANTAAPATDKPVEVPQPIPPKQYRLQVRLFDGSSIRSSFSPSQTIRGDVRPWIDSQYTEEKRPYNLKHILTPEPNRTLTIADEEQTLEELGLGSSANLVMVPINTYTEAYSSSAASLPVRAASSAYGIVSSVVGTATGLVGSIFGYVLQPAPASEASSTTSSPPENNRPGQRLSTSRSPTIRTLRDRRGSRDDSQFYNGNQLNFEPRRDAEDQSRS